MRDRTADADGRGLVRHTHGYECGTMQSPGADSGEDHVLAAISARATARVQDPPAGPCTDGFETTPGYSHYCRALGTTVRSAASADRGASFCRESASSDSHCHADERPYHPWRGSSSGAAHADRVVVDVPRELLRRPFRRPSCRRTRTQETGGVIPFWWVFVLAAPLGWGSAMVTVDDSPVPMWVRAVVVGQPDELVTRRTGLRDPSDDSSAAGDACASRRT